jgi:protoporphyrinogen/coproporphyrinogen III oxidase
MSIAIIGGGITGLTAAFRLRRAGVPVTLYEASNRVGGVIQTTCRGGFLAECGPNTILETSPVVSELVRDLRIESLRLYSDPAAKNRYVLRGGRPMPVPHTAGGMCASRLFSTRAKLRLLAEPFVPRAAPGTEESVADFVLRRLGREFLDYAINPMIAGIYAGDPRHLSVTHAFPKLHATEQTYGSLILGQFLGARERRKSKEVSKQSAPKFSFRDGLQTLINALQHELHADIWLRAKVQALRQTENGWRVSVLQDGVVFDCEHTAVLLAAPAFRLADIAVQGSAGLSLAPLREIPYAPAASLVLGFRREDVAHPLDGFGVLVPEVERRNILGAIFSSSLFPYRAPAGHVTISCYIGGMRAPELAARDTASAVALALDDLRVMLGVRGKPVFVQHTLFPKAIPQYEVGFGRFRNWMNQFEARAPGLFLAGHFRDGISLSDSIVSGDRAAERLGAFVAGRALTHHLQRHHVLDDVGARKRSADWQSAVSPTGSRQTFGQAVARENFERSADCKSAIRQTASLRYEEETRCTEPHLK